VPAGLFDAQGCLTAEGFARIEASPPGRAPAELAAHLAACARCQRRLLAAASPSGAPVRRRERPPLWRTGVAVMAVLLLMMVAMAMLRFLTTAPR
jgi:hypothetical protein